MNTTNTAPSDYIEERNRHVQILKRLKEGFEVDPEEQVAALQWAISHLEGLPEHWVHVEAEDSRSSVDAARYRYLRDCDPDIGAHISEMQQSDWGNWHSIVLTGPEADQRVDELRGAIPGSGV